MTQAEIARRRIERWKSVRRLLISARIDLDPIEDMAQLDALRKVDDELKQKIVKAGGLP